MQLKQLTLAGPAIKFSAVYNPKSDDEMVAEEERTSTCKQAPLPELNVAFGTLPKVICEIMGFPKKYAEGMSVVKLTMSYTKHGTRAVAFDFKKPLDTIGGQLHPLSTPFVKIDPPGDGESGKQQVSDESVELIEEAIGQCNAYINGERAQGEIDFEKAKAGLNALADKGRDAMADQPSFDLPGTAGAAKKAAKRKATATA